MIGEIGRPNEFVNYFLTVAGNFFAMEKTIRTPKRRRAFLDALREGASVYAAARHIGVSKAAIYAWRADDPQFDLEWSEAVEQITDAVEMKLYKDAMAGNTVAQIFWLKSHRPTVYNQKQYIPVPVLTPGGAEVVAPLGNEDPRMVNNITFVLPPNRRDEPEDLPPLIEGKVDAA
jgi:hypothetical protein